jgi:hypothetical protein
MKKSSVFLFVVILMGMTGCVHNTHKVQGSEPQSEIPAGVRVGIGGTEVKDGDLVNVLRTSCHKTFQGEKKSQNECHNESLGTALVLKVLDHDSAIVQPQGNLVMDSSMRVESLSGKRKAVKD